VNGFGIDTSYVICESGDAGRAAGTISLYRDVTIYIEPGNIVKYFTKFQIGSTANS